MSDVTKGWFTFYAIMIGLAALLYLMSFLFPDEPGATRIVRSKDCECTCKVRQ